MKALKIFATVILSIVLFLSLFVYGVVFNLKMTVLNPNFVATAVTEIPLSEIILDTPAYEVDIPPELMDSLNKMVVAIEPRFKEETGNAIRAVYAYLLGEKDDAELAVTLRGTLLSDAFVYAMVDNLDMAMPLAAMIKEKLESEDVPVALEPLQERVDPILIEAEPRLKTQLKAAVPSIIDYVLGITDAFSASFNLDTVVEDIKTAAKEILRENPDFAGASDAQLDAYIEDNLTPYIEEINKQFTIDQTTLGSEVQLTASLQGAEDFLAQVRPYVLQFQTYSVWFIVFIVVIAGCIVALNLSVRKAARAVGSVLLAYGIIGFIPLLIVRLVFQQALYQEMLADVSASPYLETYARQVISDFISPLWWFSLGCLIAGIVLLVISFVYHPAKPASPVVTGLTVNE